MAYQTLIDPVVERAHRTPDHLTLIFWPEDGPHEHVTAARFHAEAAAFAQALQATGIGPDDLVVLVLHHSRPLLSAFWGALYLGAIPSIFPFLTEKLDPALYLERVRTLVAHSGVRAVITFPDFKADLSALLADVGCRVLSTDDVPGIESVGDFTPLWEQPSGEKIAFLQHSSGTTGLQKGVALSHRAVLNQVEAYGEAIKLTPQDVIVSWLPLYHDMGLIAGFVMPIVAGNTLVLMSPFHWVRAPRILFQAIDAYRGTLCWLPNFAYNHCVRAVRKRDLEGIGLRHWRAAINCSEPVRLDSHRMFLERFAPYGFREEALAVSYAMAENTFAVTQTPVGQPAHVDWVSVRALQEERHALPAPPDAPGSVAVVSCGYPIPGCEVAVVDETGARLPDRRVGEIIIRSSSMLSEYHARPDVTAEAIRDGWYYSGDMGYIAEGRLYVSGRKKDLIIVGGKNVYPQDLEAIANTVPGIHPGRAVAFGVMDERLGTESIVIVCELESTTAPEEIHTIERELRRRVVEQTEVTLRDVRLVDGRWLIKTSSGKIARNDNRAKYLREFQGA
jgi:fatty-acyl-CoA synthase